ncbi:hypothetical protein WOB59_00285 [Methylocystis sp. IM4]|uniref:hypothetical protein n=1 Tax=Methylocystis sp. IM4 TaxID=3136560 RepID=UPI00311A2FC6
MTMLETEALAPSQDRELVLAVRHGRGRTGGSTFADYVIQRTRRGGREIIVGDGDRRNATLAGLYPPGTEGGALQPPSDQTPDVKDWIGQLVGKMVEEQSSLIFDLGGGDQALAEFCRELSLAEFCESVGVVPLSVYMTGPDMDDFEHILTIHRSKLFETKRSMLVLNESLVRAGKTPEGAFDAILERDEILEMIDDGVEIVLMPRIIHIAEVRKAGLSFYDAVEGKKGRDGKPLDPLKRFSIKTWLDRMESQLASKKLAGWLP